MPDPSTIEIDETGVTPHDSTGEEQGQLFDFALPDVTQTANDYEDSAIDQTLDSLHAELDAESPSPTTEENATDNGQGEPVEDKAEKLRGALDDKGNAFDPSLHLYPADKTPQGRWKRIPKSKRQDTEQIDGNAEVRLQAQKFAQLYATVHIAAFGEHGRAESQDDYLMLVGGFENYMQQKGTVDVPPEADLLMCCGIFTGNIVSRPTNWQKTKDFLVNTSGALTRLLFGDFKSKPKANESASNPLA